MPLIETRGAGSAQGFGEFAQSAAVNYIEDVFSTYLYTGNGSTQTITNGIDLSTKGGLVWCKGRSNPYDNYLFDTNRGVNNYLVSNGTGAQNPYGTYSNLLTAFNSTGFSLGADSLGSINVNAVTYASWTFRKQKKFFDVVTFTSNGSGGGTFNHSLGSTPGCVILKSTGVASSWIVYHRSTGVSKYLELQSTAAEQTGTNWISVDSTSVTVDSGWLGANRSIVAYLFAHDAGGFGLSGSDNVISCGSFTTNGSGNVSSVSLGYEPQWVLYKTTDVADNWRVVDNMRGMPVTATTGEPVLKPNLSDAEQANAGVVVPNATGFSINGASPSYTYIYIAIRRGPMKVPTSGTSVFTPIAKTGNGSTTTVTNVGFPTDLFMFKWTASAYGWKQQDRLRGFERQLSSDQTGGESNSGTYTFGTVNNTGYTYGANASTSGELNGSGVTSSVLAFRRAPGFFDEVCYTGTGANTTQTHNLGVVPELIIVKRRDATGAWDTYSAALSNTEYLVVNTTDAKATGTTRWNSTTPTSTVFSLGTSTTVNASSGTYVAYLFATLAGVSKVGSYTGTGTTKQIDCGFTGGARFVLIKRTDSIGDWYVYDTARGIVAGNDPYLLLNSTAAEVTNTDYVDTYSAGFELSSTAPAALNANGGSFIFFAVA